MVTIGGMKMKVGAALAGASFCLSLFPAFAGDLSLKDAPFEGNKLEITGYGQLTSDYIFRGLSQNRRNPALQGGLDATYGLFYAGTFASKVDFGPYADRAHVEVDVYGGIRPKLGNFTFDFGIIAYTYPVSRVDPANGFFDPFYYEGKAGVSTTLFTDLSIGATVYYSPDAQFEVGGATTLEGTVSKPLFSTGDVAVSASGTIGSVWFDDHVIYAGTPFVGPQDDYLYWNLGVTTTFREKFSLDLRWWDTNLDTGVAPCGTAASDAFHCGSAFQATAKVAF